MQHKDCTFAEYEAWFDLETDNLKIEPGNSVIGPFSEPYADPDRPPWLGDFAIIYPDDMYVRVTERYRPLPKGVRGTRYEYSFHYGPCSKARDEDGFPTFQKSFELRIDIDRRHGKHIHYNGEDHVQHTRIKGINFDDLSPFTFIAAVEEHRKSGKPMHEILQFNVRARK